MKHLNYRLKKMHITLSLHHYDLMKISLIRQTYVKSSLHHLTQVFMKSAKQQNTTAISLYKHLCHHFSAHEWWKSPPGGCDIAFIFCSRLQTNLFKYLVDKSLTAGVEIIAGSWPAAFRKGE